VIVTSAVNPARLLQTEFTVTLQEPNLPPTITIPASIPVAWIGRVWSVPVSATDPDQTGELRYSLTGQPPAGLTIDEKSGLLRWEIGEAVEPGDVPISVQVTDAGTPSQSATASLTVKVEDDAAAFTYLVGCIRDGDRWTAWLYDRSLNKSRYVKVGDDFTVADIKGKVTAIDLRSMQFSDAEGVWKLEQEQPLRQAELVAVAPPAATPEAAPAPAATPPAGEPTVPTSEPAPASPPGTAPPVPPGDTPPSPQPPAS
jgi:hypothetical protein